MWSVSDGDDKSKSEISVVHELALRLNLPVTFEVSNIITTYTLGTTACVHFKGSQAEQLLACLTQELATYFRFPFR